MGHVMVFGTKSATEEEVERALIEVSALQTFYDEVRKLTAQHDEADGAAVVYVDKLHVALSRVNENWWNEHWGWKKVGEEGA